MMRKPKPTAPPALSRAFFAGLLLCVAACSTTPPQPTAPTTTTTTTAAQREAAERVDAATIVIREIRASPDGGVPRAIAKSAHCVAIIPGLVHAGVLVAARAGRGVFSCRSKTNQDEWSAPAFISMRGASAGLQAGIERTDLLLLAMTDDGEAALNHGKMQIGASTSITAGPIGRSAQASDDITLRSPVIYYARASGLFVGVDLSGTVLEADEESMRAFYGDTRDFGALLRAPKAPPQSALTLKEEVARWFAAAPAN